jgi:hypothetical protein
MHFYFDFFVFFKDGYFIKTKLRSLWVVFIHGIIAVIFKRQCSYHDSCFWNETRAVVKCKQNRHVMEWVCL